MSSQKMKILTISTSGFARKEGISTVILDYYSYFDKEKFELDIIVSGKYSHRLITQFENIGVNIYSLPSRKVHIGSYITAFIALFRERKYDALYIHGSSAIMSLELLIAKMCRCKIRVVHSHNTTCNHIAADKLLRPVFYHLYTQAFACGQQAGEWLYGKRKFVIVKNGRSVERYKFDNSVRCEIRKVLNIANDVLVIGHVGSFIKQKNHEYLIRVFKALADVKQNVRLYLMGAGQNEGHIKMLVDSLGVGDRTVFTGSINNIPQMLQAMDVMVLPSLYEGLPLVAVEWQISALPCLVSDTVTRECAYTDLVNFKSLADGCSSWAEEIIRLSHTDRAGKADEVIEKTYANGYDIEKNVSELQSYFIELK